MEQHTIAFPGLGIGEFTIDSVAFNINIFNLNFTVRWYGIIFLTAIVCGAAYWIVNAKRYGLQGMDFFDGLMMAAPFCAIFSRLYYVIFSPGEINGIKDFFNFQKGGFAIYGFIFGIFFITPIFCKIKKCKNLTALDLDSVPLLIAQSIGRWGNFMNVEAYGRQTSLPWGMEITEFGRRVTVHPTFLYESLWNITGLIALHFYSKKRKFDGEIFFMYMGWYGLGRAFIEGLRTDSLMLGNIRFSQVLAAVFFVMSITALVILNIKTARKRRGA